MLGCLGTDISGTNRGVRQTPAAPAVFGPRLYVRRVQQEALFYEFSLERHVPETHLVRLRGPSCERPGQ